MTPAYCIYVSHIICNPQLCSLGKCPIWQKHRNIPLEKLYELGLKERPVQQV